MTATLNPYPAYKASAISWLGDVPAHWTIRRIKTVFREKEDRSGDPHALLLSLTRARGVVPQAEAGGRVASAEDLSKYKRCQPGDLVMNRMQAWSGMFGVVSLEGVISPDYSVFVPTVGDDVAFFEHLFKTPAVVDQFAQRSRGIGTGFNRLYTPDFGAIAVATPPPDEQAAIVRYLDYVDRRIRRYIRAKQKLIKLLEEQKQAIIHQAVTRGLDPNVPLKPSGVEWLGDVPAHWEVRRLKTLLRRMDQGVSPQADNCLAEDGTWGVLKAGCVNHGNFREREHKRLPHGFEFDLRLAVAPGDIVVSRANGSSHLVGSVGRIRSLAYNLILSDKTFRPVFAGCVDSDFMVLAMNSRYYRRQVERAISGAEGLANNLPSSSLRGFCFALPPADEQRVIADALDESVHSFSIALANIEHEIDLLREYRTRLIADVVTGKLDVREAAANLPEDEEPESLEEEDVAEDDEGEDAEPDDVEEEE